MENKNREGMTNSKRISEKLYQLNPFKKKEKVKLGDQQFEEKINKTKALAKKLNDSFLKNYNDVKKEISTLHKEVKNRLKTDQGMYKQAKSYYDKVCSTHTSSNAHNTFVAEKYRGKFKKAVQEYLDFVEKCDISNYRKDKALRELLTWIEDLPADRREYEAKILGRKLKTHGLDGIEIPIIENYEGKRFLIIFTGGTIGSVTSPDGKIDQPGPEDNTTPAKLLLDKFHGKYGDKIHFDTESIDPPTLSENIILDSKLNLVKKIIRIFEEKGSDYDGIFLTHGSDTLAYTTLLLSTVLPEIKNEKGAPVPTFVVSANKPLDHTQSNGLENLKFAVDTCVSVDNLPSAVFVIENWKVPGQGEVIYGPRITQCKYVKDTYGSLSGNNESGTVNTRSFARIADGKITILDQPLYDKFPGKVDDVSTPPDETESLTDRFLKLESLTNRVHAVKEPQSGLNYEVFKPEAFDVFIQGPYHGGTVCVEGNEENFLEFAKKCRSKGVQVILGPLYGPENRNLYGSTTKIDDEHIPIIMNISHEMLLEKVRLAYSFYPVNKEGLSGEERQKKCMEFILKDVSHEWVLQGKVYKKGTGEAGLSKTIEIVES